GRGPRQGRPLPPRPATTGQTAGRLRARTGGGGRAHAVPAARDRDASTETRRVGTGPPPRRRPRSSSAAAVAQVQRCEFFLLIYRTSLVSSVLVKLDYTFALNKKAVVIVDDKNIPPLIVGEEADTRVSNFEVYELRGGMGEVAA